MPNLPSDFDWMESPPRLDLLSKFVKPRDAQQVMNWQFLKQTLRENPETVIERFVRDGALVSASIEESLECLLQVTQLKKLLQERGLKVSGSKNDLVERLVSTDHEGVGKIVRKNRVMKCSPMALEILSKYEKKKQHALDDAKKQSFESLKNNIPKDACKIYVAFQREFIDPGFELHPLEVGELQNILSSQPKILAGISPNNVILLRAAACMESLWRDESPEIWLPTTFTSGMKNNRVALNYLTTHARIKGELEDAKDDTKSVKFEFFPGDIESCELCQSLKGKIFEIDQVPELPMIGCKSDIGCQCQIESLYDKEDNSFEIDLDTYDIETEVDPVGKLRQLKQMLEEELITSEEYEKKKEEILARF
jgi:hypothetical protein